MSRRDEDRESSASRRASPPSEFSAADRRAPSRSAPRKEWDSSGIDEPSMHLGASDVVALQNASTNSRFAASRSHEANDAYLARVDEAFRALGVAERESAVSRNGFGSDGAVGFGKRRETVTTSPTSPTTSPTERFERDRIVESVSIDVTRNSASRSSRSSPSSVDGFGDEASPKENENENETARWLRGPVDPAGVVKRVSDRPLTCLSLAPTGDLLLVGGADHAVYAYGVKDDSSKSTSARKPTPLRGGHAEWVTCVTHDRATGDVFSGGMDSRVCRWTRAATQRSTYNTSSSYLEGHAGSVSCVLADEGRVASASYDKTVRLWRVSGDEVSARLGKNKNASKTRNAKCVATLKGHSAPALLLAARPTNDGVSRAGDCSAIGSLRRGLDFATLASGDRGGKVLRWDAESGSLVRKRDAHEGHCTSLTWIVGNDPHRTPLLASGGQDGVVRFWDDRQSLPVACVDAHRTMTNRGAVSEIAQCVLGKRVVTAGADGRVAVHDTRFARLSRGKGGSDGIEPVSKQYRLSLGDFAYSLCVAPNADVAFIGDGSGNVHVLDVNGFNSGGAPSVAFALGAHRGAARAVVAGKDGRLFSAGDDGFVASYAF